jgi:hypothetical protein
MNATARLSTTKPELLELDQMRLISEAIHVAAALGVADLLAAGPKSADELSKATGTSAPSLHRVMRALASFVIFSHDSADRFALTPLGEFLKRDMPGSLHRAALLFGVDLAARSIGRKPDIPCLAANVIDGAMGISFVDTCIASSAANGQWLNPAGPLRRATAGFEPPKNEVAK